MPLLNSATIGNLISFPPAGGGYDSDAETIITAVEAIDGEALETTVTDAINAFVVGCKADGNWTNLNSGNWRLLAGPRTIEATMACGGSGDNPSLGSGLDATRYNRATGIAGIGGSSSTTAGAIFNFRNNDAESQDDKSMGYYATAVVTNNWAAQMSSGFAPGDSQILNTSGEVKLSIRLNGDSVYSSNISPAIGLTAVSRTSSSTIDIYVAGVTDTGVSQSSATPDTDGTIWLLSRPGSGTRSANQVAFGFVCPAIPDMAALEGRVEDYLTSISGI